jgi:Protein of unknown function (DUF1580)
MNASDTVARLRREGLMPTVGAVAQVNPKRISYRTGLRWCLRGINGIRLESVKAGGRRMTSVEAVERFFAALDDRRAPDDRGDSRSAEHRGSAADAVLASHGLGRDQLAGESRRMAARDD